MIFIVQQWSVRTERTLAYTKLVTLTTNELPANVIVLTGNSRWSHSRLRKEGWSHSRQIELPACAIVLTGKPRPLVTPTAVGCPQRNCVDWKPGQVPADLRAARTPRGWSHPGTTWNRRITADHRGGGHPISQRLRVEPGPFQSHIKRTAKRTSISDWLAAVALLALQGPHTDIHIDRLVHTGIKLTAAYKTISR